MNKIYTTLALVAFVISNIFAQGIDFESTKWQEALEKAKSENKLLFVDAYAQWCGPCKRMAKHEFTKEDVGDYYNSNFVNLKLDMETPNGRTFDSQYPVSAYPTMFFLDGEGKVVKKIKGGQKGHQLIAMGKSVMGSHDFSGDWREKYDEGDRSYETVYNYVKTLNKSKKPSLKISNEYLKSDADMSDAERFAFEVEAASEADSKLFENLVENQSEAIKLLGEEAYNEKIAAACEFTVDKAIKFEYEGLLDEAIEKASTGMTSGGVAFGLEARKKYALEMRFPDMYISSVKALAKEYKSDNKKLKSLITEIMTGKVKSGKLNNLAVDLAKKYNKGESTPESAVLYAKTLAAVDDYKKAVKVLSKSIKGLDEKDKSRKSMENLKKLFEQKLS